MNFAEIHNQIEKRGFTAISNPLEDLILSILPDSYYRVWRLVWRNTIGWNKVTDRLRLETIAEHTRVHVSDVSRALHFFDMVGLIKYEPGTWKEKLTRITVLPEGLPDNNGLERIADYITVLAPLEDAEKKVRHSDPSFRRFLNKEFRERIEKLVVLVGQGITDSEEWNAIMLQPTIRRRRTVSKGINANHR